MIFDDNLLKRAIQDNKHVVLPAYDKQDYPLFSIDDAFEGIWYTLTEDECEDFRSKYRPEINMYESHRIQKWPWCPQYLIDLLHDCQETSTLAKSNVITFFADRPNTGYNWHADEMDIVVTNVIGNTTWTFEDGSVVDMKPYDLMFIPMGVRHTVVGHSARFTAAIGNDGPPFFT